jgi:hypothetical protein
MHLTRDWLKRQPGARPPVLLVEDPSDLLIICVGGQPADQLDRVLGGAVALGAATDQRHLQLGVSAVLPVDLKLGPARLLYGSSSARGRHAS